MKEENAYLTVEAALVFPVVIWIILFVVYMLLFQYDRCLLEQDLGAFALWASCQEAKDAKALEERIQEQIGGLYREKYVAWEFTAFEVLLEKNCFSTGGGGRLTFPMPSWIFWNGEDVLGINAHYSCSRLSPVTFIRLCHSFKELINEEDADENAAER